MIEDKINNIKLPCGMTFSRDLISRIDDRLCVWRKEFFANLDFRFYYWILGKFLSGI